MKSSFKISVAFASILAVCNTKAATCQETEGAGKAKGAGAHWDSETWSYKPEEMEMGSYEPGYYATRASSTTIIPRHADHYLPWNAEAPGPLSSEQMQHFREHGFVVVRGAVPPTEVAALENETEDLRKRFSSADDKVTDDNPVAFEPNTKILRSIFSPHRMEDTAMASLLSSSVIPRAAAQLVDSPVYIHQSRINFQPALVGTGFSWHSDFETWHSEDGMPVPRCLSAVVMLSRNRATNGALMVIPGSHQFYVRCPGLQPDANWEKSLKEKQTYGSPSLEQLRFLCRENVNETIVHITGESGDVLFFDSNLMHGSHSNISPYSRVNLFAVYNSVENQLGVPLHGKTQRPEHIGHRTYAPVLPS